MCDLDPEPRRFKTHTFFFSKKCLLFQDSTENMPSLSWCSRPLIMVDHFSGRAQLPIAYICTDVKFAEEVIT